MTEPFIGYVSSPFGTKKNTDFDALYDAAIVTAPHAASATADILLFREDASRPPWHARHRSRIERFRGGHQSHEWQLRDSIQENIVGADFVIAVLTDFNPNVMLEIGFAQAQKKMIIYALLRDQFDLMPSNLANLKRLHLYKSPENLRLNLYARIQEVIGDLRRLHEDIRDDGGFSIEYYPDRDAVGLPVKLRAATAHIQILTTNLTTVSANFIDPIVSAVKNHPDLDVKILTSDPENAFIIPRADQLVEDTIGYRMELQGSLESIRAKLKKYTSCEVRTYKDFPVQLWHRIDDYIYVGQSSLVRRTRYNCVFGASVAMEGIKETYLDHFERLWRDSTTLPDGSRLPGE